MKIKTFILVLASFACISGAAIADEERSQIQAKLNSACEVARAEKITPLKNKNIEECSKKRPPLECAEQYQNYGERIGNKVPLFYNLPECVKADEYLKSERSAN